MKILTHFSIHYLVRVSYQLFAPPWIKPATSHTAVHHFVNLAACLPVMGGKLDCFYIALFWGMVVYIDEFEMKEYKIHWNPKNNWTTTVSDQNRVKKNNN